MKNNYLIWILIALSFLGLIHLWFFYFDYSSISIIALSLGALIIGLLVTLFRMYAIPSKWAFKNRFGIDGLIFSAYILFISPLWSGHAISLPMLFVGFGLGIVLLGYLFKSNYTIAKSKKSFDLTLLDGEILSDMCSSKVDGKNIAGMLILTKMNKLLFIPVNSEKPLFNIDILELSDIQLQKKYGLPYGFIINERILVTVSYPRLWVKTLKFSHLCK